MLPSADRLLEGLSIFVRRRGLVVQFNRPLLIAAMAEAEALAAGNEHDEPASLFYACARRPGAFGKAGQLIVPFLVQSQARAVGLELGLEPDDVALILMRLRVVRGEIGFGELRDWFASQLRPVARGRRRSTHQPSSSSPSSSPWTENVAASNGSGFTRSSP